MSRLDDPNFKYNMQIHEFKFDFENASTIKKLLQKIVLSKVFFFFLFYVSYPAEMTHIHLVKGKV